jgi:CRISPR/Cas system-associated exonuclease Cas4 (RecB family)
MNPTQLSPHDLHDFLFCPRTLWWRHVAGLRHDADAPMRAGAALHTHAQHLSTAQLNAALDLHALRYRAEVRVADHQWRGRVDLVAHTAAGLLPIELKLTHHPDHPAHLLQLALYARLLAQENGGPVGEGILWLLPPARHRAKSDLDRLLSQEATIRRVRLDDPAITTQLDALHAAICQLLNAEPFPAIDHPIARCELCRFIPFCHDRTPWRDADTDDDDHKNLPDNLAALLHAPSLHFY